MKLSEKVKLYKMSVKLYHDAVKVFGQIDIIAKSRGEALDEKAAQEYLEYLLQRNELMKDEIERLSKQIV